MKLLYLAPAASFQILVVVATLVRSEVQVTDSTEKELLAEIKSVPVRIDCFCSFYSARENALNIHWEAAIKFPSVSNCAKSLFIK